MPFGHPTNARGAARNAGKSSLAGVDSLRLDQHALDKVHALLSAAEKAPPDVRREWGRRALRIRIAEATFLHPGGTSVRCVVSPRSLSAGGIGMLHGGFVHIGTPVVIHLTTLERQPAECEGKVVRCRHIVKHVHEVGVRFKDRIDPRLFLSLGEGDDAFTLERVAPEKLQGRAIVVEPDRAGQRIIAHFLRPTHLEAEYVEKPESALELCQQGYDVVMVADIPGGATAVETLRALRAARVTTATILLCSAETPDVADAVANSGAAALLCKPFDERSLHRALGELLLLGEGQPLGVGAITSALASDTNATELIECFVRDLDKCADDAMTAFRAGDAEGCKRIALHLKGAGSSHGFKVVTDVASAALDALHAAQSVEAAGAEIRRLVDVCRRCTTG